MTILLTGASGFLGRNLARKLASDHHLVCMSRKRPQLPGDFVLGAFHLPAEMRKLDTFKFDVIVHLAAVTGGCSEEDGIAVNVLGTQRLIRYGLDHGCRRFVLASSICATGCLTPWFMPRELPMPATYRCEPKDAYGLSKWLMEENTRYFANVVPDADFTNLRIGAVTEEEKWKPEPRDWSQPWSHACLYMGRVFLSDVLDGLMRAANAPHRPGVKNYYLVGPDAACNVPVPEVMKACFPDRVHQLDLSHYQKPGHEFDPIYSLAESRAGLGYEPKKSVRPELYEAGATT